MLRKLRPRSIYDVMAAIALLCACWRAAPPTRPTRSPRATSSTTRWTSPDVRDDNLGFGGLFSPGPGSRVGAEFRGGPTAPSTTRTSARAASSTSWRASTASTRITAGTTRSLASGQGGRFRCLRQASTPRRGIINYTAEYAADGTVELRPATRPTSPTAPIRPASTCS